MRHLPHLLQCSYGHVKVFDLQFCKSILKVLSNTANIFSVWRTCSAFNGEYCEKTMILFWNTGSLLTDSNKLLHIMYKLMLTPINQSINQSINQYKTAYVKNTRLCLTFQQGIFLHSKSI
jgi:hypothetical protein